MPAACRYVFADRDTTPPRGHEALVDILSEMLDPFTRRRLAKAGLRPGMSCLEVGAGNGSVAAWLTMEVSPGGTVTATDIDISYINPYIGMEVLEHDITTDPLPDSFDLIHARLVLAHLPRRTEVLAKLVKALNPGGVLVVEEFDASWAQCVMGTPDRAAHRLFAEYHDALMAVLETSGTDPTWGRRVHLEMRAAGLSEVESEFSATSWHGGQAGCLLPYHAAAQLRDRLLTAGMAADDLDALRGLLRNPELVVRGNTAVSTIGHAPRA